MSFIHRLHAPNSENIHQLASSKDFTDSNVVNRKYYIYWILKFNYG